MKKILLIFFSVLFITFALWYQGFFERPEQMLYDIRVRLLRSSIKPPDDIAVILIDEASIKMMNSITGRWPWPRSVHADVIDFLRMGGAKAVVFDILFTEKESSRSSSLTENDLMLIESTMAAGNVYHAAQLYRDIPDEWNKEILDRPLPQDFIDRFSLKNVELLHVKENNNFAIPFKELYHASKGIGIVEFSPDSDGIYRKTSLIRTYHGNYFPVLSFALIIDEARSYSIKEETGRLVLRIDRRTIEIPLLKDQYLINLYGGFEPYSMSGVLASIQKIKRGEIERLPISPDEFRDKVVFIGASAVGVEDLKPTSLAARTPGVLLHASIYGNILKEDFLKVSPKAFTLISTGFMAFAVLVLIFKTRVFMWKVILSLTPIIFYIAASFIAFRFNFILEILPPFSSGLLSFMAGFTYLSLTEEKEKKRIKGMLGRYVSSAVLSSISEKKEDILLGEKGMRMELTVLFSDIEGFTNLSERLPAEAVVEILNSCFTAMVDIIFRYQGTLDKFMGDAIMAFWGAPVRMDDHARKAVLAGLEMKEAMIGLNRTLREKGLPEIRIGTGINTGEVILGNIGSPKRLDYTVIGDDVNLASRLQSLTRRYKVPIIISEATAREIGDNLLLRPIDIVRVKGKAKPVKIFEPLRDSEEMVKITLLSEKMLEYYLNRRWQEALALCEEIERLVPGEPVSGIFRERLIYLMRNEPDTTWDGVWEVKEK